MTAPAGLFWGVDCGSSEIKVAVADPEGRIVHRHRQRTLFPLSEHIRKALVGDGSFPSPFTDGGTAIGPAHRIIATGYGRSHLDFIDDKLTEIKAHYLGVDHVLHLTEPYTIVDIGGQDSKVIVVKDRQVEQFAINRKCAAGTGAFIEELAHRLELDLAQMASLEQRYDKKLMLNSYCTVFAGQEVIKTLMDGEKVENLIHALYESVVKRVTEMTAITTPTIVFSGGVLSHHLALHGIFQDRFKDRTFILAPHAQFSGAIGAAIFGLRRATEVVA